MTPTFSARPLRWRYVTPVVVVVLAAACGGPTEPAAEPGATTPTSAPGPGSVTGEHPFGGSGPTDDAVSFAPTTRPADQTVLAEPSADVLFEVDADQLSPAAADALTAALEQVRAHPGRRIVVEGHTDDRGSDAHNDDLSLRRARAVVTWLVEHGADPASISAEPHGERHPIAANTTPEGRRANRRVTIVAMGQE